MHYGKHSVSRWTFISGAKISAFMDILGLFDRVDRVLDKYFSLFPLRKASGAPGSTRKGLWRACGWCPPCFPLCTGVLSIVSDVVSPDGRSSTHHSLWQPPCTGRCALVCNKRRDLLWLYMIYNLADLYQGLRSQVDRLVSIKNSWLKLILQFLKERSNWVVGGV